MIHWSNELKKIKEELSKQSTGESYVFRNGERLELPRSPNENVNYYKEFATPIYRIPAAVITNTGRIIVGADYRSKPNDQVAITPCVAYSDDNGATWTKKVLGLPLPWEDWYNANCRVMDQTMFYYKDKIYIICGRWNGKTNNTNWTQTHPDPTWGVWLFTSSDNGETWELDIDFKTRITGFDPNTNWLGGVGNAITTKFGTCIVPIQLSKSNGAVSMSFIYSNDGTTWTKYGQDVDGLSETSVAQIINSSGNAELLFISRRDPNNPNNKAGKYVNQTGPTNFGANFADYGNYNGKIPARGGSGCMGSAISNHIGSTKYNDKANIMVSFAENFQSNISAYQRDNIVVGMFCFTNLYDNGSRVLREFERIDIGAGTWVNGVPYGGYSILAFNPEVKKLGIAYESMGSIKYKDLSHLIPVLTYDTLKV